MQAADRLDVREDRPQLALRDDGRVHIGRRHPEREDVLLDQGLQRPEHVLAYSCSRDSPQGVAAVRPRWARLEGLEVGPLGLVELGRHVPATKER